MDWWMGGRREVKAGLRSASNNKFFFKKLNFGFKISHAGILSLICNLFESDPRSEQDMGQFHQSLKMVFETLKNVLANNFGV